MTNKPKCPHCQHIMSGDEMNAADVDLWAIAPNEDEADITCPQCGKLYQCQGGYLPTYESTTNPEGFDT